MCTSFSELATIGLIAGMSLGVSEVEGCCLASVMGARRRRRLQRHWDGEGGGGGGLSKSLTRLSLTLVLGVCFSVHIWNWMVKCLDRDTIMVLSTNQVRT